LFYLTGCSLSTASKLIVLRTLRIAWVVGAAKPQGREEHRQRRKKSEKFQSLMASTFVRIVIAANGLHLRSVWDLLLCLPGSNDKLEM
jgi:hypothetical protein